MIAVDTNLLVYAHRQDSPFHHRAAEQIRSLAESPSQWAIPWPCLHEFYSIVTHRRIYSPPSTLQQSIDQIEAWLASPSLVLLSESETHWTVLRALSCAPCSPPSRSAASRAGGSSGAVRCDDLCLVAN